MPVCIVGDHEDLSAVYLGWLAERRGVEGVLLREDRYGLDWHLHLRGGTDDRVVIGARSLPMPEVRGAFVRFHPQPAVAEELGLPAEAAPVLALERRYSLHWWLDRAPFPVVNRPHAGRSNASKPQHMRELERAGFDIPDWLVTNRPDPAAEFVGAAPAGAVYKASSGLRSHVRRAGDQLLERLSAGTAPVLIQRYIPGLDVRIHVVGARTFATAIHSDVMDYRFDEEQATYAPASPPRDLLARCVRAAAAAGLALAGLDFRHGDDGRWWCLEMNPVPTFLPYEAGAGHPIGDAVLDHLLGSRSAHSSVSPLAVGA